MSFTPGPWVVSERPAGWNVQTEMGATVATCWRFSRGLEDSTPMEEANAHLIAAAFDLLEAAKQAKSLIEKPDPTFEHEDAVYKALCAAIEKAEEKA